MRRRTNSGKSHWSSKRLCPSMQQCWGNPRFVYTQWYQPRLVVRWGGAEISWRDAWPGGGPAQCVAKIIVDSRHVTSHGGSDTGSKPTEHTAMEFESLGGLGRSRWPSFWSSKWTREQGCWETAYALKLQGIKSWLWGGKGALPVVVHGGRSPLTWPRPVGG